MATITGDISSVTYRVYFDDRGEPGWVAEYHHGGAVVDDSEKIWHPDMPRRRDASRKAETIARRYARMLARRYAARTT